jgi:hypothetical protein
VKKARKTAAAAGRGEHDASAERRKARDKRPTEMAKLLLCALLLISHRPSSIPNPHYSSKPDLHPPISG